MWPIKVRPCLVLKFPIQSSIFRFAYSASTQADSYALPAGDWVQA